MKKLLVMISLLILFLIPNLVLAKKVICASDNYSATLELIDETIYLNNTTSIAINSEYAYSVTYNLEDTEIGSVSNTGIVKGFKEGNTKINAEINFLEDNKIVESCRTNLPILVVSNDSSLKMLNIEEFDISEMFNPDIFEYTIQLPYNIEKVNIIATANSNLAKISGTGIRYLNEGTNIYEIIVTASDNTTSSYKITIERAEASDDSSLNNLIVEGYILNPVFNKGTYKYTLNLDKKIDKITIKAEPTNEFAKVLGTGTFDIASGDNYYYINVLAENSTNSTYEIHVYKNKGSSILKSLEVKNAKLEEEFISDKYIYHTTIGSKINHLELNAEAYENGQIEILNNEDLFVGKNEIIIKVTSKDKTATTYKIIANKLTNLEEKSIEKYNLLLKIIFIIFIFSIAFMVVSILIFTKRNFKHKKKFTSSRG